MSFPDGTRVKIVISGRESYAGGMDRTLSGRRGTVVRYKATYSGYPAYLVRFDRPLHKKTWRSYTEFWVPAYDVQRLDSAPRLLGRGV